MKSKKLILLTASFPYGNGESFLESEISYLADSFAEVIIISASTIGDKRPLPVNVRCQSHKVAINKVDKLKALFGIFSKAYRNEKNYVSQTNELEWSKGVRNTALISWYQGKRWSKTIDSIINTDSTFDFVVYSYWCSDSAIGASITKQKNDSVKCVSRTHGWDLYFEATQFNYLPYRRLISKQLDMIYAISNIGVDYMETRWKADSAKLKLSRLGVKQMNFLTPNEFSFSIVSVSNVIPLKRVELIAKALQGITDVNITWTHFGEGNGLKDLRLLVAVFPENIQVELKGHQSNSEVLDWYALNAPHLFLNVSTTEGIPVSIMEAMSFGTPVLATNVGGTSEIVNSKNGGFLLPDLSEADLRASICEFFNLSEEKRSEKRCSAFKTWETSYNAELNYTKFTADLLD